MNGAVTLIGVSLAAVGLLLATLSVVLPARRPRSGSSSLATAIGAPTPVAQDSPGQSTVRRQQRLLLPTLARRLPRSHLQLLLSSAGEPRGWTVDRLAATSVTGAAASGAIGCITGGATSGMSGALAGAVVGIAIGTTVPFAWLRSRARQRSAHIASALPDAIDLLAVTVAAGLSFDAALARVAHSLNGPLAEELRRMGKEIALGRSRSAALEQLGQRTGLHQVQSLASAIGQAEGSGTPIGAILRSLADEQRTHRFLRMEERAAQLPVKLVIPLVLCVLPALFVVVIGPAAVTIVSGGGLP